MSEGVMEVLCDSVWPSFVTGIHPDASHLAPCVSSIASKHYVGDYHADRHHSKKDCSERKTTDKDKKDQHHVRVQ